MIYVSSLEYVRRGVGRGVNKAKSFLSARDVHTSGGHVGEVVSPEASFTCDNTTQSVNTLFAHLEICTVTVLCIMVILRQDAILSRLYCGCTIKS